MVHPLVVTALKTTTLLFGGLVTFFAFRAYRRTHARPLGLLALGFAIVTLGSLLAGVVDLVSAFDTQTALVVESALTATGFGVIAYSLYARD
ncbi:hypothetical protein N0B31_06770 [Salinirubellus salinus]|jgi:hypothetical protein|uniref:Uncharacterized protein n=1 Tax=Salinirubellus salinus TaxID=1364945 RepID=A0A9E7R4Z8_9EURY|nr:hypothetical protein [Salinirubellus salinus]UWM55985.1 hypothetical protein N0B31_06770 [Salinirubellus salinus]